MDERRPQDQVGGGEARALDCVRAPVRLLADDLTGALDSAAEFARSAGPLRVYWDERSLASARGSFAFDACTRECSEASALAAVARLSALLAGSGAAFKKVDSLLRGHALAELAASFRSGHWHYGVFAPAFPYHGRITRGSRQYARADGRWEAVTDRLDLALSRLGVPVRAYDGERVLGPGVTVFDAENDAGLAHAVEIGRSTPGAVLWCGSGGLAQALAGPGRSTGRPPFKAPILGLFGSDRALSRLQVAACAPYDLTVADARQELLAEIGERLARDSVAMIGLEAPREQTRAAAAQHIRREIHGIIATIPRPLTLLAGGGETLRAVCSALGASALEVRGRLEPGLPWSVLCGGHWDGTLVISKSGSFGGPRLWRDLLAQHEFRMKEI